MDQRNQAKLLTQGGVRQVSSFAPPMSRDSNYNDIDEVIAKLYPLSDLANNQKMESNKFDPNLDNQNGRVTIVKKLQKYSEIVLGSQRQSLPKRGQTPMLSSQTVSNLPMLSKNYMTSNLMD